MCGLVGCAGDLMKKDTDVFADMLYADGLRGFHSTGAALIGREGKYAEMIKAVGSPLHVIWSADFQRACNPAKSVLIGHNRYATIGEHTEDNTHPFKYDNIIGAHNGTLDYRARQFLDPKREFGTDSAALYAHLDQFPLADVMKEISGAWALTWYDKRDNTINFLRNDQRPLFYAFNEAGDVIYWASEAGLIKWVCERREVKLRAPGVLRLNPGVHVKFVVAGPRTVFDEGEVTEVKAYSPPPFTGNYSKWPPREDSEVPWFDGEEMGTVLEGWSPHPKVPALIGPGTRQNASSQKSNDNTQKSKSGSEKRQNALAARRASRSEHGSMQSVTHIPTTGGTPSRTSLSIDDDKEAQDRAYEEGVTAGQLGRSAKACPFPPASNRGRQWLDGRKLGLEWCRKPSKPVAEILDSDKGPMIRGYGAEWLDKPTWMERTNGTCTWGGCDIEFDTPVEWLNSTDCVCSDCVKGNKLVRELLGKAA